jgi:hypothetical protein
MPCRTRMRPPRFRTKDVSTCMGSPTARGSSIRKPFARGGCCLLVSELDRHLGIRPVSQLDTQPVVSPVNASRLPSRAETSCITRGRGGWLGLTPWKTCTSYPLPAFLAHSAVGLGRVKTKSNRVEFSHGLGHERLGGASGRSSNVRNAPLGTVARKRRPVVKGPGCVERGRYEHHCQWDVGFGDRGVPI